LTSETFEVSIDTSQHAFLCPLKAFSGLDRPRENLKGLKQVLLVFATWTAGLSCGRVLRLRGSTGRGLTDP